MAIRNCIGSLLLAITTMSDATAQDIPGPQDMPDAVKFEPTPTEIERSKQYFPNFAFDESIERSDGSRAYLSGEFVRVMYAGALAFLDEPPLNAWQRPDADYLRLVWLRSFHDPVAVRATMAYGEPATISFATREVESELDLPEALDRRTRTLDADELRRLKIALTITDICHRTQDEQREVDGSTWLFELRRPHAFCFASPWSPTDGPHRDLGDLLLELAGFEESAEQPIY